MFHYFKHLDKFCRLFFCFIVFIFFTFNSINISIISNNVIGKNQNTLFDGLNTVSWESSYTDLEDKVYVSSYYNMNEYFALNNKYSPFKDIPNNPDNIYAGYYLNKLQSVQYIYSDVSIYYKLNNEFREVTNQKGTIKQVDANTEAISWCHYKSNIYITLYKVSYDDKNSVILAISDRKLIKEQLNYNQSANLPTSLCYREEDR